MKARIVASGQNNMADLLSFELAIFLGGTFAAAFVTGLAGFAFGMVAASIWLYALTPLQASILILAYGLLVQGYAVWKLRHSLDLYRLAPFVLVVLRGFPPALPHCIGLLQGTCALASACCWSHSAFTILFAPSCPK